MMRKFNATVSNCPQPRTAPYFLRVDVGQARLHLGSVAGCLTLADEIRVEVPRALQQFRSAGVSRIVLASGDRQDVTAAVGSRLDIDAIRDAMTPQDKVATVLDERKRARVMMVGDGVNDAPALAAADVGVALGARGSAALSEVADVVLLVDCSIRSRMPSQSRSAAGALRCRAPWPGWAFPLSPWR
jgi:P-type E1-E2 ATPase